MNILKPKTLISRSIFNLDSCFFHVELVRAVEELACVISGQVAVNSLPKGPGGAACKGLSCRRPLDSGMLQQLRIRRVHSFHLLLICVLSTCSFGLGFLAAVHPSSESAVPTLHVLSVAADESFPHRSRHDASARISVVGVTATVAVPQEEEPLSSVVFQKMLPYPFEHVIQLWEGGPPDPNFLREEVVVQKHGAEEHRTKRLYTRNPLPWILKKTFVREEVFVFAEDQRINLQKRYSVSSCDNKVLESFGKLHRVACMSAHKDNPNWTNFTQSITCDFTSMYGAAIKHTMERFAETLFLKSAKSGTDILEIELRSRSLAATVAKPVDISTSYQSTTSVQVSHPFLFATLSSWGGGSLVRCIVSCVLKVWDIIRDYTGMGAAANRTTTSSSTTSLTSTKCATRLSFSPTSENLMCRVASLAIIFFSQALLLHSLQYVGDAVVKARSLETESASSRSLGRRVGVGQAGGVDGGGVAVGTGGLAALLQLPEMLLQSVNRAVGGEGEKEHARREERARERAAGSKTARGGDEGGRGQREKQHFPVSTEEFHKMAAAAAAFVFPSK